MLEAIKRKILEEGPEEVIKSLLEDTTYSKEDLEESHIIVNGYPNLSLLFYK